MSTNREKLLGKIKALLQKTVANGCTESETMAALAKAQALMDEYELTEADLTFGGEQAQIHTEAKDDRDDIRGRISTAVAKFCGCMAYKNGIERVAFVGLKADTVFAHWLLDTLHAFVERECRSYLLNNPSWQRVRRMEERGFKYGCADRIVQRLHILATAKPDTAMTVQKNELITAALTRAGVRLRDRMRFVKIDTRAERAGLAAGNHATFDKPIGHQDSTPRITGE